MVDVVLRDVTLRDGLQDEDPISTDAKLAIFDALVAAGVRELELTSFVRPDRVPAMADAEALCAATSGVADVVTRWGLVLNGRGAERALAAGLRHLQYVVSVTDTHSQRNAGRDTHAALGRPGRGRRARPRGGRRRRGDPRVCLRVPVRGAGAGGAGRRRGRAGGRRRRRLDRARRHHRRGHPVRGPDPRHRGGRGRRPSARGPPPRHPRPGRGQRAGGHRRRRPSHRRQRRRPGRLPVRARGVGQPRARGPGPRPRGRRGQRPASTSTA